MPGPGGGSRGGGGGRGGSFGGGFSGGSRGGGFTAGGRGGAFGGGHNRPPMGGGMPPPPPHHHGGGFYGGGWRRPRTYYGGNGGCFGGIFTVVVVGIFVLFGVFYMFGDSAEIEYVDTNISNYDENVFQDFADKQYKTIFGKSTAYEDNILLVFLTEDEQFYDYYYIAWVGDHIDADISYLFGGNSSELGLAMDNNINTSSYKYSLDSNIAQVIREMQNEVEYLGLESSFTCEENHNQVASALYNKTTVEMTDETVNAALNEFTQATGISIAVVVEDMDHVFVTENPAANTPQSDNQNSAPTKNETPILPIIIIAVIVIALIVGIVFLVKNKKKKEAELED